ncbi:CD166 antigen-like isoform X1 [Larimichthys crocea]|uniref:CD166 antigen-like isoform X1 n=1 Tax=Larimichthys crocea TaxID=215358 RepID=UPI000F6006A9|nr:CD166 antigen-like isoform X1 [Larimichthys crocea]
MGAPMLCIIVYLFLFLHKEGRSRRVGLDCSHTRVITERRAGEQDRQNVFVLLRDKILSQSSTRMFVLIWVTLLFAVRSSNTQTDVNESRISKETTLKWSSTLKLNCSADGSSPRDDTGTTTFVIPHATAESSGQYTCKATHQNDTLMKEVNVTVTDMKTPEITGNIKEGDNLNLTCNVESDPRGQNISNGTETDWQNNTVFPLLIHNVTAKLAGQYICTTQQMDTNVTSLYPEILSSSGCTTQSGVLTCTCIVQGFPLPTIEWKLNHIVNSIITTVSNHTINSTFTLKVKGRGNTSVECVSNGKVKMTFNIDKEEEDYLKTILRIVTELETAIAFLTGILLSSVTCCLMRTCRRKKTRTKENLAEAGGLEMVTSDGDLLIDADHVVEGNQAIDQEAAEAGGAVAAGKSDVEYSNLDFSLIKDRQDATRETPGTTETEYAEIKKAMTGQDGEGIEEDEETGHCAPVVEEEEDVALYSTVKDVMDDSFNEDSAG